MGWYQVIKTVKGHRYEYLQRSWREGKKVRTESRYIGPASDGNATVRPPQASDFDGVITTPRVLYHGAREGIDGPPRASESGTFGPGLYLTVRDRAEVYARYDAKIAADVVNGRMAYPPPPKYDGRVYAYDVSGLKIKELRDWNSYFNLVIEELAITKGYTTPEDKVEIQKLLQNQGYDGIYVKDEERTEMIIFQSSIGKLKMII
jgi:hypothetical protein